MTKHPRTTHGHCTGGFSKTYHSWRGMVERCTNPKHIAWKNYGGRGIAVCERWKLFENFLADMGERPEGMSLDRTDPNKGYSPTNCRWATNKEQARSTRKTKDQKLIELVQTARFLLENCVSYKTIQEILGISKDRLFAMLVPGAYSWIPHNDISNRSYIRKERPKGSEIPRAALKEDDIKTIRARAAAGELYRTIAKDFPVGAGQISKIVRGQQWKHVQ